MSDFESEGIDVGVWDSDDYGLFSSTTALIIDTTDGRGTFHVDDSTCSTLDIVTITISLLIAIVSIPISFWSMMSLYDGHSARMEQQKSSPKSIYRITMLYQCCTLFFFLILIPFQSIHCLDFSDPTILSILAVWTYTLHWMSLMILHLGRLRISFKDTLFVLEKRHCILFLLIITSITLYILSLSILFSFRSKFNLNLMSIIWASSIMTGAVLMALISLLMLSLYIRRLLDLNQQIGHRMIASMVRYTILSLLTTMMTVLLMVSLCLRAIYSNHSSDHSNDFDHGLIAASNLIAALNVFTDLVAVSCSFGFGDRVYNKWCGYGHSRWMRYCTRNHDIVTIRTDSKMSRISTAHSASTRIHYGISGTDSELRQHPSTESLTSRQTIQHIAAIQRNSNSRSSANGAMERNNNINFHQQHQLQMVPLNEQHHEQLVAPQIENQQHLSVMSNSQALSASNCSEGVLEATEMKLSTEGNYIEDIRSLASLVVGSEHLANDHEDESFGVGSIIIKH